METPRRSFRVTDERYQKAQRAAKALDTDLTSVVNDAFDKLVQKAQRVKGKELVDAKAHPLPERQPIVYYIRNASIGTGSAIKIGTSMDFPNRMDRLQKIQPALVPELLGWEPGGGSVESRRHWEFRAFRLMGEWFWPVPEILGHIASLEVNR